MKTTQEYFNMSIDELLVDRGHGYTREECKILDAGIKITFFDNTEEYNREKEEHQKWVNNCDSRLELKAELITINERIAVIYA